MPLTKSIIMTVALCLLAAAPAGAKDLSWTSDEAALLFYEGLTALQKNALDPPKPLDVAAQAVRQAARGVDQFSDYWPPEEYRAFKQAANPAFAGVGMEIWADKQGGIVCIPDQGGPAQAAGVAYGDLLLAVDGQPVSAQALYSAGARIRGEAGKPVVLRLRAKDGAVKNVTIVRRRQEFSTVELVKDAGVPRLRIARFTNKTAAELAAALRRIGPAKALIIDLRGNVGGDLFTAMDSAAMFLPVGAAIVSLQQRSGLTRYKVTGPPINPGSRLFIWQDGHTASAAEVFTAALTRNQRAVAIGETSFGKGVAQKIVELSDGSALLITYASLIPPDGKPYHGQGLSPDRKLPPGSAGADKDYALLTAMALGKK